MSELSRSAFDTHIVVVHLKQHVCVTTTFEAGFDDLRVKDQRGRSLSVDTDKNLYRTLKVRHTSQQEPKCLMKVSILAAFKG